MAGWIIAAIALGCLPVGGLHAAMKAKGGSFMEKFKQSLKPKQDWGPRNPEKRKEWLAFKERKARELNDQGWRKFIR